MSRRRILAAIAGMLTACSSVTNQRRITVDGTTETADADTTGTMHFSVHHAWLGEGALRHPMAFVGATSVDAPGAFEVRFDVPTDEGGEGLVLYAWHDRDGDGVLCGMSGDRRERSGAVVIDGWPTYAATVALELTETCAGAETFVP
jgi:hypothetical protein